jgi:hypothetical protein
MNGHVVPPDDEQTLRNAEEFELDELASDDEGDGERTSFIKKAGLESES